MWSLCRLNNRSCLNRLLRLFLGSTEKKDIDKYAYGSTKDNKNRLADMFSQRMAPL